MQKPEINAKGVNGQIELYESKICIRRKGVMGFLSQGLKGDKNIMITAISSVQLKKAGMLTNGYIQFSFMGGKEAKGGLLQGSKDENTVMFTKNQQSAFEKIREAIEIRIQAINSSNYNHTPLSGADEIVKFAELRDKGVISEEEFQQKKTQLLGL